jgi:putative ABC transport system permease protein
MAAIDDMFANGPQRVKTTTEAEFQAQFVSMIGNVPLFVTSIGGAVLVAILLASLNAMLMASREQVHDIGILKALGFTSGRCSALLLVQGLLLCCLGGFCGVGLALLLEPVLADALGATLQGYRIARSTIVFGVVLSVVLGLLAGLLPAWNANRLECVSALSARG